MKIAFLSNYTPDFLVNALKNKLSVEKIAFDFYTSGFDQYAQEILNNDSKLYSFNPEIVFFSIDLNVYCKDLFEKLYQKNSSDLLNEIEQRVNNLFELVSLLNSKLITATLLIDNFFLDPVHNQKTLEYNSSYGTEIVLLKTNLQLAEFIQGKERLRIVDILSTVNNYGKLNLFDDRFFYIAKNKWSSDGVDKISDLYLNHLKVIKGIRKKCIVLDLDNTLWGGVIGQDGIENILLSNDGLGKSFYDFQVELLKLFRQGIILAICSKNSEEVALEAIKNHPYMILKPEHFAATRINWENKAQNIRQIAEELNIGIDSLVFLDDSPFERGLIKQELPEVTVPDLPDDPVYYPRFLKELNYFNVHRLTDDDFNRNSSYQANKERKSLESSFTDITSFLKSLEMEVTIKEIDDFSFPRAVQLIQKTNQFNVTTRRYSESEMKSFYNDSLYSVLELSVRDKFGDYGLVGIAIVVEQKNHSEMYIDSFIMSCRVIGRNVETALLSYINDIALNKNLKSIRGEIIPTAKNAPSQDLYKRHGFNELGDGFWSLNLEEKHLDCPDYIKMNQNLILNQ